jgi:2-polyprenyl-3-methyl-5-hydroxy-6-metoxy-1,4-benzoquinol methylase
MESVLRADEVKTDFDGLKKKWEEMLNKYYLNKNTLNPAYTLVVSCHHCKSEQIEQEFELNGFWHKTCASCQSLYVSPRLSDECIEDLYSDSYYNEVYVRSLLPVFETRKKFIGSRKFAQVLSFWDPQKNKKTGSVLDIGAGIGEVSDVFKDNGWKTHLIEMNEKAVEWLQTRNHDSVFHGNLDQYNVRDQYDVVMAWGVVEHVADPDKFLQKVFQYLKPGGIFVSEVPHGKSLLTDMTNKTGIDPRRILMGEQHIILYSIKAYIELHERNGLKKVHVQTNGLDCDTIFKENNISVPDAFLRALQSCIDEQMYGDLLRGFWRR